MMSDKLNDWVLHAAVLLEGAKAGLSEEVRGEIMAVREQLKTLLDADDELARMSRRETAELMRRVQSVLSERFGALEQGLADRLEELAAILAQGEYTALQTASGADVRPAGQQAAALLKAHPLSVQGLSSEPLLQPFIRKFSENQQARISAAIVQGVAQGLTNQEIRQSIIGTKKAGYADGVIGATMRSADAVVRTGAQHVSSVVRQATAQRNADIVQGVKMVATLDSRTSAICRSIDGKVFPIDKGPRPPLHINCRTSFVLVLKPEYRGRQTAGQRASQDGQVSDKLDYFEWLAGKPAAFQDQVLGKGRAELFRNGGLTPKQFADLQLDKHFRPRTLDELREAIAAYSK